MTVKTVYKKEEHSTNKNTMTNKQWSTVTPNA